MPRRGFTLLEVLLALGLSSMLMAGLFATLRVQGRMAREGGRRVEIAQLARGLLERMADDVRSSIPSEVGLPQEVGLIGESFLTRSGFGAVSTVSLFSIAGQDRLPGPLKTLATHSDLPGIGLYGDAQYLVVSPRAGNELMLGGMVSERGTHAGDATTSGVLRQPTDAFGAFNQEAALGRNAVVGFSDRQMSVGPLEPPRGSAGVAYFLVRDRSRVVIGGEFDAQSVAGLARLELTRSDPETATALIDEALKSLEGSLNGDDTETEEDGLTLDEDEIATSEEAWQRDQSFYAPGLRVELLAPEVGWLRFRYLGPYGWESDWTSHATMPRAVEIVVGLKTDNEEFARRTRSNRDRKSSAADSEEEETASNDFETEGVLVDSESFGLSALLRDRLIPPGLQVYRLTVRVPTASAKGVLGMGNTVSERMAPTEGMHE